MNQELIDLFNLIHSNIADSNIVYENKEGELYASKLGEFANNPIEDILDKLNLNVNDIIIRSQQNTDRFINDMAAVNLICYFKEFWEPKKEG